MSKYRVHIIFGAGADPAFHARVEWAGEANSATGALTAARVKFADDYPRQRIRSTRAWVYAHNPMRPGWREVAIETGRCDDLIALLHRADRTLSTWVDSDVRQLRRDIADALDSEPRTVPSFLRTGTGTD